MNPVFPADVAVGDRGVPAAIDLTSRTLVPILLLDLFLDPGTRGVRLSPEAVGAGPACPSTTFDVAGPDAAGRYTLRPRSLLNIVPVDVILLNTCTVSFTFDVTGASPPTATQSITMRALLHGLPLTVTSFGTSSMRISGATSTLSVAPERASARVGETLPVRADLSAPTAPSGTVEFGLYQDGSCSGPVVARATAPAAAATTATLRPDRPGRHWVGARYAGDAGLGEVAACASDQPVQVIGRVADPILTTTTRPDSRSTSTTGPDRSTTVPTTTALPASTTTTTTSTTSTTTIAPPQVITEVDDQLRLEIAAVGLVALWLPFAGGGGGAGGGSRQRPWSGGGSGGGGRSGGGAPGPGGAVASERAGGDRNTTEPARPPSAGEGVGWGDQSFTFRAPGRAAVDTASSGLPARVSAASPLLARMLADGTALRAAFGSLSVVLPLGGVALGVAAALDTGGDPNTVALPLVLALVLVGTFDALAGWVGAVAFAATLGAAGALDGMDAARFVVCLTAAFYAPALVGGALRPIRREPTRRGVEHVERLCDALAIGFVGWLATFTALKALPGASGRAAPIADDADLVALVVAVALVCRVALETAVAHGYPARLRTVCHGELPRPRLAQQVVSHSVAVGLVLWIVAAYTRLSWQILLGAALVLIPAALASRRSTVARHDWVRWLVPTGYLRVVAVMVVAFVLAELAKEAFPESDRLVRWSILLLAVPIAHLEMVSLLAPTDGSALGVRSEAARSAVGVAALVLTIGVGVLVVARG